MENIILKRRESLILTAIDIINELGIQGLSTREVAKRQKMSNAAIFNHFRTKSELIDAVLDHYSQYDTALIQTTNARGLKAEEAILFLFDSYITYYENYPAITSIVQAYDIFRCEPEFEGKIKSIMHGRRDYLREKIQEAQNLRQIRDDIDSNCILEILLGSWRETCLNWRMEGYSFSLKERALYTLNVTLDSFKPIN